MLDVDCQSCSSIDHSVNFIYTHILVSYMYCKYSRFTLQAVGQVSLLHGISVFRSHLHCLLCSAALLICLYASGAYKQTNYVTDKQHRRLSHNKMLKAMQERNLCSQDTVDYFVGC